MAAKKKGVPKKGAFLAAFVLTASITAAAKACKLERGLHYRWLADDEQYRADFRVAVDQAAQTLEDEAVRRAYDGVEEPVIYQGELCFVTRLNAKGELERTKKPLVIRKYDSSLLMFLLRGMRPEKYRERGSIEHSGPGGGPIPLEDARLKNLTDDELAKLAELARKLTPAGSPRGGTETPGPAEV